MCSNIHVYLYVYKLQLSTKSFTKYYIKFIRFITSMLKDLVRMVTYRHTLECILVINRINVIYVVKDLVRMVAYRDTLDNILVINHINVNITFIRFITSMWFITSMLITSMWFITHMRFITSMWFITSNW
jgi:hypothetical protein